MSDQSWTMHHHRPSSTTPSTRQMVRFITAATIGASLLFLSGLTLSGAVIALVVATPLLVLFSPILVPAAIVTSLITAGFFFSGGCGMLGFTAFLWVYNYVSGKHPPGADKLDSMMGRIANKVREIKNRTQMHGKLG